MKARFAGKAVLSVAAVLAAMMSAAPLAFSQSVADLSSSRVRASATPRAAASELIDQNAVIIGVNSVYLGRDSVTTGSIIVNAPSTGPVLGPPKDLKVDRDAKVTGDLFAASIQLSRFTTTVNGQIYTNSLDDEGATCNGVKPCTVAGPYAPPVYALPPFDGSAAGGPDINVGAGQTVTIPSPGFPVRELGHITIGQGGKLILLGGTFTALSVNEGATSGQCPFPCRSLLFMDSSVLRVGGRFSAGKYSQIGPASSASISASNIIIQVAGLNGDDGSPTATPAAAGTGQDSHVAANFYVANGTMHIEKNCACAGAYIARDVKVDQGAVVSAASVFGNKPPAAEAQSVVTNGAASIDIILKGSDPEGQSLTFSILTPPTSSIGYITAGPTPIVPPAPPDRCSVSGDECMMDSDCPMGETCDPSASAPITMASVTYTPVDAVADAQTSFTFQVADPPGLTGAAVVSINDIYDNSSPPPPATAVSAPDISAETTTDTPVTILFSAGACSGSSLGYAITSLPASGSLSDDGNDIASVPYPLSGTTVVFTPAPGFNGNRTFDYSATDNGTVGACSTTVDTGTATVNVSPPADFAPEQMVETSLNTPIEFLLGGPNQMAPGAALKVARVSAAPTVVNAPLPGATIAGNVYSTNGTTGTGKDNLPGSAPVFIAAAVDVATGGPTLTWTLSGVTFDDGGTASGTFDYDPNTETVSNWDITVTAGTNLAALTYTTANSTVSISCPSSWGCPGTQEKTIQFENPNDTVNGNGRQLRITPIAPLTAAGGTIAVNLNTGPSGNPSGSVECYNCAPFRQINGGSLTASPSTSIYRIQIEWDVAALPSDPSQIEACEVKLITNKGTVDSLDTTFYAGAGSQNGTLDLTDFEAPTGVIPLVLMPASIGVGGTDVAFSFDVTGAVQSARSAGFSYFSIQGRVDEGLTGGGFERGLQIRSSASGNLSAGTEPQLVCQTGGGSPTGPQLSWQVLSLPGSGTKLLDAAGAEVTIGQTFNFQPILTFLSPTAGTFSFQYKVTFGAVVDTALVTLVVDSGDKCLVDGRRVNCSQSQCSDGLDNDGDFVPAVLDENGQVITPAKGGIDWDGILNQYPPDTACSGPSDDDEFPVNP